MESGATAAKPRTAYGDRLDLLLQQRQFSELFEAVNGEDADTVDQALTRLRIEFDLRRRVSEHNGNMHA
jgi:hypothetical protein